MKLVPSFLPLLALLALPGAAMAQDAPVPLPAGQEQTYDPAPAMWRLADGDTTIYLLGTFHLMPEQFRWRNPQLDAIVAQADELVLESSDADATAAQAAVDPKLAQLMERRTATSQLLSADGGNKWQQLISTLGLEFAFIDRLPLHMAMLNFGRSDQAVGAASEEYGVETVLEREFAASNRPILSIEDNGRVMMSLFRINDTEMVTMLDQQLAAWDGRNPYAFLGMGADATDTIDWPMLHNWARGLPQNATVPVAQEGPKAMVQFDRALLAARNRRWTAWLADRLERPGTALVAVGAAHFEGSNSVLVRLAERGLTATRINAPVE
jgi:uncharacterized protein YbaP (TraB family)